MVFVEIVSAVFEKTTHINIKIARLKYICFDMFTI